ncbi:MULTISPECIES: PEP-CTERM sorting domain-containing protein [Marinobacter]|jgi:hypothetical protein|uniref:PEP-CTERM sorting domain-containing protein n=1 Tax=Marinobacter TaxID=2742 RepID=UPI000D34BFC8|nr:MULTISPECIES: PEP-CTERM sorting domain-containing protein [Marinobacter]MBW3225641.1 DUF4114 domain-containing protein [Marinobacter adhaerens]ROQ46677.1 putative secreted protein with PEP-CTERM sorting signal [Marinobacter sp. 3-2]
MKMISKLISAGMLAGACAFAHAGPVDIFDLKADNGSAIFNDTSGDGPIYDTGLSYAQLTDTDGDSDSAGAFLLFEFAGFANINSFGIYDINNTGEALQVFEGGDTSNVNENSRVDFDLEAGTAKTRFGTADIGSTFGFYLQRGSTKFYSDAALNGGIDMTRIFDVSKSFNSAFSNSSLIIAFEDLLNGDFDYNDLVVGISDVKAVSEPGTLALFGLGMLGLGMARRRKSA